MRISDWSSDVCSSDLTAATKRCELRLDVGLRAHRLELAGEVVLAAGVGDVIECAARDALVDRTGTRLHVGGLVLGTLDGHADVAHLPADTGERLVDLGLRLGRGVVGLDRLLPGPEGLDIGAQPLLGDRQRVVWGKSEYVRGDLGGRVLYK